jgi:hypothetical protein
MFGPQAPAQALGSLAIRYATYRQLYLAGSVVALVCAACLLWAGQTRQLTRAAARQPGCRAGRSAIARADQP